MNKRSTTYYYKKRSPLKGIVVSLIFVGLAALGFWYYANFFATSIKISEPQEETNQMSEEETSQKTVVTYAEDEVVLYTGEDRASLSSGSEIDHGSISTATGRAILRLKDKTEIRLAPSSNINISSTDEVGSTTFLSGRAIVKGWVQNVATTTIGLGSAVFPQAQVTGGRYELRAIDATTFEVVALEENIVVTIFDKEGEVSSTRLDLYERLVINTAAGKHSLVRVYDFNQSLLTSDQWYVWSSTFFPQEEIDDSSEMTITESDSMLELAATEKENGILLTWAQYDQPNFKRYEILRSSLSKNPTYGKAESIKSSTTRSLNSFMDYEIDTTSSYHYRVCVISLEGEVLCGNSASIERAPDEEIVEDTKEEKINLIAPTLSIAVSAGGATLSWNQQVDVGDISYSILRSQTNPLPLTGEEIATSTGTAFTDLTVGSESPGSYFYRVCAKVVGATSCSGVIEVRDGSVQ